MENVNITSITIEALDDFSGAVNLTEFNRNLRNLLLQNFIDEQSNQCRISISFLDDMKNLISFLDLLEDDKKRALKGSE